MNRTQTENPIQTPEVKKSEPFLQLVDRHHGSSSSENGDDDLPEQLVTFKLNALMAKKSFSGTILKQNPLRKPDLEQELLEKTFLKKRERKIGHDYCEVE